ncbi:MAG: phosphoenolpyruvate carboxykinase (ATP) [Candidatus Krumholzibacteriota bacterium]|nr:phosphoenolpyruvate carboxykinase (ATP) [Candidatus Krumholzibacteriota bacterium]
MDSSDNLSPAKELVKRITEKARKAKKFIGDRERIESLALKDKVTLEARGTRDVLTRRGSPAFVSRITSRSAPQTEIFFGLPDERQAGIMEAAAAYLEERLQEGMSLLFMDKMMGLHDGHTHHCRTVLTPDYARLLVMWNRLVFDLPPQGRGHEPQQVQIMIPEWADHARQKGLPPVCILVDADSGVTLALGSDYFGEVKKGHLRMAMYREKQRLLRGDGGGLGVHAGGKVIRALDSETGKLEDRGALFFGLSGTGKTTLSVHHFWLDPARQETVIIRQDDFFVLSPSGEAFGTEDNAYIKTEGLEAEGQPLLYAGAVSPHALLENVYIDPETLEADFFRYDHPHVPGGLCMNGRGIVIRRELDFTDNRIDLDRVDLIFFITRRETIIPPVMKLDQEQAGASFMLGESILTSAADPTKAGQSVMDVGTNPFIVGSKGEEGNIFYDILKRNPGIQCFLFNTGGFGGRDMDLEAEGLSEPGVLDRLKSYLGGEKPATARKKIIRELRDGEKVEFKVNLVRYELSNGDKRIRDKSRLESICREIEKGKEDPTGYKLLKVCALAGQKIKIQDSAAFIRGIARSNVTWKREDYWGYQVPAAVPGVDLSRFDETRYYSPEEIKALKDGLRAERIAWLHGFTDLDPRIRNIFG